MYLQSLVRPARGLGGAVAWICQSARCPGVDLSAPARPVRGSKLSKLPCARVGRGIALAGSIVRHGRCEAGKLTLNVNLDFKMAAQKFRISSPISACAGGVLAVVLRSGWLPAWVCRAVRPRRARGPHMLQHLNNSSGCFLGASWVPVGWPLGAWWVPPGCVLVLPRGAKRLLRPPQRLLTVSSETPPMVLRLLSGSSEDAERASKPPRGSSRLRR